MYVAQKTIGKGNPKEELIKANNEDAKKSIKENGWKPGVFKRILSKAKDVLRVLINEKLRAIEALKAKSKTEKMSEKLKTKPSLKERLATAKVEADEINAYSNLLTLCV